MQLIQGWIKTISYTLNHSDAKVLIVDRQFHR